MVIATVVVVIALRWLVFVEGFCGGTRTSWKLQKVNTVQSSLVASFNLKNFKIRLILKLFLFFYFMYNTTKIVKLKGFETKKRENLSDLKPFPQ